VGADGVPDVALPLADECVDGEELEGVLAYANSGTFHAPFAGPKQLGSVTVLTGRS
jgi:hypothetical protein